MKYLIFFIIECLAGFALFAKLMLKKGSPADSSLRVSVIIPARNEELNLPHILDSLAKQTLTPHEIIVVDDFSTDQTNKIANSFGVKVIMNSELPENWTGKAWAVWNGYLQSTGDILVFLDADVRLSPEALESLVAARENSKGAISVVPYHYLEKFYEKLSMILYLLGVFAFTSPFERANQAKCLYGSCIVAARKDYEAINGHDSVKSEILDDLNLGKRFYEAGINVENFIGCGFVSFRMYPNGLQSEIQGFGKGAVLSTSNLKPSTTTLIAVWVIGLLMTGFGLPLVYIMDFQSLLMPFLAGYLIYAFQIFYFLKYTGHYGLMMPFLHLVSSAFFVLVMLYSLYQVKCVGSVSWKGRQIKVGGN